MASISAISASNEAEAVSASSADWEAAYSLPPSARQQALQLRSARSFIKSSSGNTTAHIASLRVSPRGAREPSSNGTVSVSRSYRAKRNIPSLDVNVDDTKIVEADNGQDGIGSATSNAEGVCSAPYRKARAFCPRPTKHRRSSHRPIISAPRHPPRTVAAIDAMATEEGLLPPRLGAEFFMCDALDLAPKLLGKYLCRDDVVLRITEVEAYRPNDTACHGRVGITARTAPLFGPGGRAYVYLCYGLHIMLNIVADIEGIGAAVLIRSCAPVAGLKTIQARRGQVSEKPVLLNGPGKVGQALGLTTDWSNHPLYTIGGLEVLDGPAPQDILVGPRVGIDYAAPEDVAALWRYAVAGTPWVSAPRNTLRPPASSA